MQTVIDALNPSTLQPALWRLSYALVGAEFVDTVVSWLQASLQAERVVVTRAIDHPVTRVRVVAASPQDGDSFLLAGRPCEQVYRGQPLALVSGLEASFPQGRIEGCDSYHGFPLMEADGCCSGHLMLGFANPTVLPDWLQTLLAGLCLRLAAELRRMAQESRLLATEHQLALHNQVLHLSTANRPLNEVLDTLLRGIEAEHPGVMCSIMAPDRQGQHLHLLSAPSLPADYLAAIEGVAIGPGVGSCGTAAFSRQRVIVSDISRHPYWADFRELAARFSLGSCWSQPIQSGNRLLGAFAIYHPHPCEPGQEDFAMIDRVSDLTGQLLLHHETMEALRLKSEHYQMLLRHGADGTVVLDRQGHFLEVSDGFLKQIGASNSEAIQGTRIWDWSVNLDQSKILKLLQNHREQPLILQTTMRHVDGSLWDAEITTTAVQIDGQSLIWASARDVTERKKLEAALLREARLDSLTGIANRGNFLQALEKEVARARRYPQPLSVLMLDLDHFKAINDRYGHSTGDDVLRTLCRESAPLLRKEDLMGRLGGEEFAIMLPHTAQAEAGEVAQRLLAHILDMAVPVPEYQERIHFSCSIGVATLTAEDRRFDTLLSRADKALYQAKETGRARVALG